MLVFVYICIALFCNHLDGEKKALVALFLLSFGCLVTVNIW